MTPLQQLQELRNQLQAKSLVIRMSSGQDDDNHDQVFTSINVYKCLVEEPDIEACHRCIGLYSTDFDDLTEAELKFVTDSHLELDETRKYVAPLEYTTFNKPWILASCFYLYLCERSDMYTSYIVLNDLGYKIWCVFSTHHPDYSYNIEEDELVLLNP